MNETPASLSKIALPPLLVGILQWTITLLFPVILALLSVRLVMTPLFLQLVYNRSGFPEDYYGLTTAERLEYAPLALEYLLNGEDITFLGDLQFPDGSPMYNPSELRHMQDVKIVTQSAFLFAVIAGSAALITGLVLFKTAPRQLRQALFNGSLLTLTIIAAIVIVAIFNWNTFFTTFHQLFFESGTWRFAYSDTLIRLFPEEFWFEAALTIGALTVIEAVVILALVWRWQPNVTFDRTRHDR
ncbi:MAG TPA: TIGR01906 family membrane protein [Phototrophicaceae bacterium]|nr:TIGR01906 family membrane protein [Phototrophicaceae bacterium]